MPGSRDGDAGPFRGLRHLPNPQPNQTRQDEEPIARTQPQPQPQPQTVASIVRSDYLSIEVSHQRNRQKPDRQQDNAWDRNLDRIVDTIRRVSALPAAIPAPNISYQRTTAEFVDQTQDQPRDQNQYWQFGDPIPTGMAVVKATNARNASRHDNSLILVPARHLEQQQQQRPEIGRDMTASRANGPRSASIAQSGMMAGPRSRVPGQSARGIHPRRNQMPTSVPTADTANNLSPSSSAPKSDSDSSGELTPVPDSDATTDIEMRDESSSPTPRQRAPHKSVTVTPESPAAATSDTSYRHAYPPHGQEVILTPFENLDAHTAKCDLCNKRNGRGMSRCTVCGWQTCHPCTIANNCFRKHNGGGRMHIGPVAEADLVVANEPVLVKGKRGVTFAQSGAAARKPNNNKGTAPKARPQRKAAAAPVTYKEDSPEEEAAMSDAESSLVCAKNLYAYTLEAIRLEEYARAHGLDWSVNYTDADEDATEPLPGDEEVPNLVRLQIHDAAMEEANHAMESYRRKLTKGKDVEGSKSTKESDGMMESDTETSDDCDVKTKARVYCRRQAGRNYR